VLAMCSNQTIPSGVHIFLQSLDGLPFVVCMNRFNK
jgi:hypothetical protein